MRQPAASQPSSPPRPKRSDVTSSMSPIKASRFGYAEARHLLWRAGFGGTPDQIKVLSDWGPEKSVDYLLEPEKVEFDPVKESEFDRSIIRPPTQEEQAMARQARRGQDEEALAKLRAMQQQREGQDRRQMRDIQRWWLTRMIETPRPLEEKMTLFWHGHFATSFRTIENSYHMFKQNMLLRKHALGNFGELLFGIIRDPAMLAYLDQNDSRRNRPNENLARELMELFSLGVGNYSEADIKEGARALTGYTFQDDEFVFRDREHDPNPKTILGQTERMDGDDFVRVILSQQACSRFMARKLYKYFAADIPPLDATDNDRALDPVSASVIRDLASVMRSSKYEIKPVLRRLFLSEHFYDPRIMGQQIKGPVQLVVGAVRSLNTPTRDMGLLVDALDLMGQKIFEPPSVKGWDGGRSWINTSTLYVRQNILAFLLTGKKPVGYDAMASEEKFDPTPLLDQLAKASPGAEKDIARVIDYLLRFTLGNAPSDAREMLTTFAKNLGVEVSPDLITGMLLLITAMPEYQLC
jgi:uncharacterized protein (DUF1800 family)